MVSRCASQSLALALLLPACAGSGVSYEELEAPIEESCVACHDSSGVDTLVEDVLALDDAAFDEATFPDSFFPSGLIAKSVEDLISTGDPAPDAALAPSIALRKAWVLHELHELQALLEEPVPPDFTGEDAFVDFATLGNDGAWEGCEIADKLDLGYSGDPEGMPPLWAPALLELLGAEHADLSDEDRQTIKDFVDGLLPGGLRSCEPGGEGSAS